MDPLTVGLITGGTQLLGSVTGFFGQQNAAAQRNKQLAEEYKQRMLIQNVRDMQRFGQYRTKKVAYKESLDAQTRQYGMQLMQDQLQMNELIKGAKVQTQNDLVNKTQALGRIGARGVSGQSAAKAQQSALAEFGRRQELRMETLLGQQDAMDLRTEARTLSLDASRMKAFNTVRFAPGASMPVMKPQYVEGPSSMSLLSGIGSAALSGFNAGLGQANFKQNLLQNPLGN